MDLNDRHPAVRRVVIVMKSHLRHRPHEYQLISEYLAKFKLPRAVENTVHEHLLDRQIGVSGRRPLEVNEMSAVRKDQPGIELLDAKTGHRNDIPAIVIDPVF